MKEGLTEILHFGNIKQAVDSYSKAKGFNNKQTVECIVKGIEESLSNEGHNDIRVKIDSDNFIFYIGNKKININDLKIRNIYQFAKDLTNRIISNLNQTKFDSEAINSLIGTLINVSIININREFLIGDYEGIEVFATIDDVVKIDRIREGNNIKMLVKSVNIKDQKISLMCCRNNDLYLKKLFEHYVPEVSTGVISVVLIKRFLGLKNFIVLSSSDPMMDPVKIAVGINGIRTIEMKYQLTEKLDLITFSSDLIIFCRNLFKKNFVRAELNDRRLDITVLNKINTKQYPELEGRVIREIFPDTEINFNII